VPISIVVATIGVAMIGLGIKGFTSSGIAFSKKRTLTGRSGKIVGGIAIGFGALLAIAGFAGMILVASTYD